MKTGDRFCFISKDQLATPLPREAMCGRFRIRLFHDGQFAGKRVCFKCFSPDHIGYTCSARYARNQVMSPVMRHAVSMKSKRVLDSLEVKKIPSQTITNAVSPITIWITIVYSRHGDTKMHGQWRSRSSQGYTRCTQCQEGQAAHEPIKMYH